MSALYVLPPNSVTVKLLSSGNRAYEIVGYNGEKTIYLKDEVIHISAFGTGEFGLSPIGYAREMLGTA